MSTSFTAIDFETAQGKRWSICQVGLVRVENGQITDKISKLVCPPNNFYQYRNTEIHGISSADTCLSPTFEVLWPDLKPYIQNQTVVAHNGAFDFSCLNQTLAYYGLEQPAFNQKCTFKIFRKGLADLCREYQIQLNHHDALSDALACAELYKLHIGI
jgi:DNA polymerase-3 subunit epsilon